MGQSREIGENRLSPILVTLPLGGIWVSFIQVPVNFTDMKSFSGTVQFAGLRPTERVALCLALVLGVVMLATGCGKKESPAPAAPPTAQTNQQGGPPQVQVGAAANAEGNLPVLKQLNRAALRYRKQNGRNPASVEELASAAGIQLPEPPPGKKYGFNNRGIVVLMDNPAK